MSDKSAVEQGRPENHPPTTPPVQPLDAEPFRSALSAWYRKHARVLPWRGIRNPYATWLSEIMLQQTRVATVLERYELFLRRFPTVAALAAAPEEAVLALWSGLGYYRRARMLHRGAQFVERELGGELPRTAADLRTLPGVGEYTAAAIASIAFGESVAVLDGNVERVLLRLLGLPESRTAATRTELLRMANQLVPPTPKRRGQSNPAGDHNQAMMELGATICLPRAPLCLHCPVVDFCRTRGEHATPARPQLRSRRVAYLLATRKRGTRTEVLLERRAADASLMPGMLELLPLPLEALAGEEPVLRLRHSITNTNYYVEIYAEAASGAQPHFDLEDAPWSDTDAPDPGLFSEVAVQDAETYNEDEAVYTAPPGDLGLRMSLRAQVPASETDLRWMSTRILYRLPLTGLTRKVLQRLGLMSTGEIRIRAAGSV